MQERAPKTDAASDRLAKVFDFYRAQRMARTDGQTDMQARFRDEVRPLLVADNNARVYFAARTNKPFRERLATFWSNHFTVSHAGKRQLVGACLPYEVEAVRPHLDGRFDDLLLAVEAHPVMLMYLDNQQSVGPSTRVARRRGGGLNENLAREILELHTLGVKGGYDQADVVSLARIITGWTVSNGRFIGGRPGEFRFVPMMHEPGAHTLLGKAYLAQGLGQGQTALRDLARHPSTARFVATKLVKHFVADTPPPEAVARIERVFLDSDGHLPTVHRALVHLDAAWDASNRKLKTPYELVVSTVRGLGIDRFPGSAMTGFLRLMNHVPFTAPSPAGWPDDAQYWAAPSALKRRVEWGLEIGARLGNAKRADRFVEHMAPAQDKGLRRAIARAQSPAQGLGLLLASPNFQWRV